MHFSFLFLTSTLFSGYVASMERPGSLGALRRAQCDRVARARSHGPVAVPRRSHAMVGEERLRIPVRDERRSLHRIVFSEQEPDRKLLPQMAAPPEAPTSPGDALGGQELRKGFFWSGADGEPERTSESVLEFEALHVSPEGLEDTAQRADFSSVLALS